MMGQGEGKERSTGVERLGIRGGESDLHSSALPLRELNRVHCGAMTINCVPLSAAPRNPLMRRVTKFEGVTLFCVRYSGQRGKYLGCCVWSNSP